MANNRLFVGNTTTKKYFMACKGWGSGWRGLSGEKAALLNAFLTDADAIPAGESDGETGTGLVFFAEGNALWDEVFADGTEWTEYKETG